MTDLLLRLFVKDYEDVSLARVRTSYGVLSSFVGICCNVLLFITKLVTGMVIHSISVMSDACNNLSDAVSSVIALVGVHLAEKPSDREHPYGHGRIEYLAALIVSFLVLEVGWTFLKTSIGKIRNPEKLTVTGISLVLLIISVFVKLWMAAFNRKLGQKINSKVMEATAADSLGDVLATTATIFSLLLFYFLHINVDGWIGLGVSLIILLAGIGIARDTVAPLIGESASKEDTEALIEKIQSADGILGTHDLQFHQYGPSHKMATIHVCVDNRRSLEDVHRMVDKLERQVEEEMGIALVIHTDPVETRDKNVLRHRSIVLQALSEISSQYPEFGEMHTELHAHDFHMVREETKDYLSFDLEIPYEIPENTAHELTCKLKTRIREMDKDAECIIIIDRV